MDLLELLKNNQKNIVNALGVEELDVESLNEAINEAADNENYGILLNDNENPDYVPHSKFHKVNETKKDLEQQLEQVDEDLDKLETLTEENEELETELENIKQKRNQDKEKLKERARKAEVDSQIVIEAKDKFGAKDARNDLLHLVDREQLEVSESEEGYKVAGGLESQLENLKENKPYLFGDNNPEGQDPQGGGGGKKSEKGSFGKKLAQGSSNGGNDKNPYFNN